MAKPSPGRHRKAASKVWPSRAGDIINKGMGVVDVLGAKKALETAKLMKGNEDAVIEVADKWSEAAARLMAVEQPMSDSWNSLTADWEGGAYDAFVNHMRRNAKIAQDNSTALLAAENALLDLSLAVANSYNLAVDLTTLAASHIESALGHSGLISKMDPDKPAITDALLNYVEAINKVDTDLRTALTTQKVGLAKFAGALTQLNLPGEFPENAENPKRWIYR
jgi:hypothetical protein